MRRALALALCLAAGCGGDTLGDGGPTDDAGATDDADTTPDLAVPPFDWTTAVSVYVEPAAGAQPVVQAIAGAKTSIDLEMYLLTDQTMVNALIAAKNAGRQVRVILEQNPTAGSNAQAQGQLSNAGIAVHWSNPAFTLTHEKAMILDGSTLWAMTMNFSASAVTGNREYLLVDTDSDDVADAEAVFQADWNRTSATPQFLVVAPTNARSKLHSVITSARVSVDVEWEELSDNGIGGYLQDRVKAGVPVRIIAPSDIAGSATATLLTALKAGGAQVRLLANPYLHAKMILVDGAQGFIGSENATASSLDHNRELGVAWQNAQVAATVQSTFNRDWSAATPY